MRAEQEAGNVVGDVWFNSDGHILVGEFLPNQWVWAFVPRDVEMPEITPEVPFAVARHSVDVWGYNSEIHPDGCPLTNWWQLTEPPLEGKVYTEDPMTDVSTMAKWATVAENGEKMAAAYKELYGVDWTEDPEAQPDAYGQEVPNAGWLWIKKFAQNHPTVVDEIDIALCISWYGSFCRTRNWLDRLDTALRIPQLAISSWLPAWRCHLHLVLLKPASWL